MSAREHVRVLVVDDHELVRAGLCSVLASTPDLEVVATAGGVDEAFERHDALLPDVVLSDLHLGDGTGLDVVRRLRARRDDVGVVIVSVHAGDDQVLAAMQAGASGFIGKDAPAHEVVAAARHAASSPRSFVCAGLDAAILRHRDRDRLSLTEQEHEILLLLAEGLGSAAIGEQVFLSESAVKAHVARIYPKLGAANRAQALVTAMRVGLLSSTAPRQVGAGSS